MNKLVVVKICIVLSHILILVNITTAKRGLRDSASCRYLGLTDETGEYCRKDKVKFKKLPKECSAYIYDGIKFKNDLKIDFRYTKEDFANIKSLTELKDDKAEEPSHDVYIFYKHEAIEHFKNVIHTGKIKNEAEEVNKFLSKHHVKGFILDGIPYPITIKESGDFYKNFKTYVTTLKTTNLGLEIGLYVNAGNLTKYGINGMNSCWFDFGKMNDVLDFYLIEFSTFNECEEKFLYGGITPINSADPNILTLNMFADIFQNCTIDKEKVYFEFLISPILKRRFNNNFFDCEMSYNEYCENREKYFPNWCVDTQDVLYEKGKFARLHSKGFVGKSIDLVDRDNKCKCDNKYITFYMMLRGYNNEKDKLTCDAFK